MVKACAVVNIDRTADDVWARIRDFGDVTWIPRTETSRLEGDKRIVRMEGRSFDVMQQLLQHDDENRTYSYRLASDIDFESMSRPAMKVSKLEAVIAVTPNGPSSARVDFEVDTDEFLVGAVNREYQQALENLKRLLED
jgi:hypothetical protein